MSLHKAIKPGCVIWVDDATGKLVDHIEVRDGWMYYMSVDGQVLEQKPVGRKHHFVCTACGERCDAENLTGDTPDCCKGYPVPGWKEAD